jgi:hypothetical protein
VARAARGSGRQAARLGLLIVATACAKSQEPPGGPPDFRPPALLAIVPDSGAIRPGFEDPVTFEFDEVVNELPGGRLEDLFLVSPRPERISVSWKRHRIEVRPRGGWRAGTVYQVQLLPGITDLRNNRMREGRELVFSTGPDIPDTRVSGTVVNWPGARLAVLALVEAIDHPETADSVVYVTQADSSGDFVLRALPPGEYLLVASVDENNNRRRDRREPFDSVTIRLDSTLTDTLWAFVHDTVGPAISAVSQLDSLTVRVEFSQHLRPGEPDSAAVTALLLPDSTPVAIDTVLLPAAFDSLRAAETRVRDSLAADSAARADTAARRDTAETGRPARTARVQRPGDQRGQADTARAAAILRQRPRLADVWVVRMASALTPGGRYLFLSHAANVNGAVARGRAVLVVPDSAATRPPP